MDHRNEDDRAETAEQPAEASEAGASRRQRRARAVEIIALVLFIVASASFGWMTLPFGNPDEEGHLIYADAVSRGILPAPDFGAGGPPGACPSAQAHHPPLYYAIVGGIWALTGRDPVLLPIIGRAVSVLAGIIALLLLRAAMHRAFPDRPHTVAAGFAIVVSFTSFTYMMGSFNNDPLAVLAVCVALYLAVRALDAQRPMRWIVGIGACLGVGLLAKLTAAVIVVPIAVAAVAVARREERGARRAAALFAAGLAVAALISGPWFVRNQILFGTPTFNCADRPIYPTLAHILGAWEGAVVLVTLTFEELLVGTWWPEWLLRSGSSLLALVAYPNPEAPPARSLWLLLPPALVMLAALIGAIRLLKSPDAGEVSPRFRAVLWMLLLLPVASTIGIMHQTLMVDSMIMRWAGRYIGTMAPALGMVLAFALAKLLPERAQGALPVVALVAALVLNAAAIVHLARFYWSMALPHVP